MTELNELLKTPVDKRDTNWENDFFTSFTQSNIGLVSDGPVAGPDGWPYLLVTTTENATEPAQKVLHWLSEKGVGLAVNPEQEYPDFVFPFGMIWHFRETGLFYRNQAEIPTGTVIVDPEQGLKAGAPTEDFLPSYVRKILRDFFRDQGRYAVKILIVQTQENFYDLAFSLDSLGNPPEGEHSGIAEAISWFLPPHYSILLAQEAAIPGFEPL